VFKVICIDKGVVQKQWDSLAKLETIDIAIESSSFLFQDGSCQIRQDLPDCIDLLIIHKVALSPKEEEVIKDTLCQTQYNFCTLLTSHSGLGVHDFSNFKLHYSNIPFPSAETLSHLSDRLFQLIDNLKNSNDFADLDKMRDAWHLWENPYEEEIITALNILCQGYLITCQRLVSFNRIEKLSDFDISNPTKYCSENEEEQYYQYEEIPSPFVCDAISYMGIDISSSEKCKNVYSKMTKVEYWRDPFIEVFSTRKIETENQKLELFKNAWDYSQRGNNSTLDTHVNHLFKFVAGNPKIKLYPSIVALAYLAINDRAKP
jgi:hypothetical protein